MQEKQKKSLSNLLPLVAIESSPVFPGLMASLHMPPGKSTQAVEYSLSKNKRLVGLLLPKRELKQLASKNTSEQAPQVHYLIDDLYTRGVSVRILKKVLMPDESMNLLVHGISRFEVTKVLQKDPYLYSAVKYFQAPDCKTKEIEALARTVIQQVKALSKSNPFFTEEMKIAMINAPTPGGLADMVAFAIALQGKKAQEYVEAIDVRERFLKLLVYLRKEKDMAEMQKKLGQEVDSRVAKFQREFLLKEQLKSIKKELGMEEDDKSRESRLLKNRIKEAKLPKHAQKIADDELRRLQTIIEHSPEFHLTRSYIEWIADLPWSKSTKDNLDLNHARAILDKDHFGLEDVKDRILEFLAVRSLKPKSEGAILCFVGPPGVGKTSLGKAIAQALGRKFFRFSLGGVRDEAEIKGHRRTYVGAMPGKILQGLRRAGTNNVLLMLDEIDKIHSSYHGDPASALLEVLDPEQNKNFLDHYIDIPFDLSKIMFIATANSLSTIPSALKDRLEIIELSGYTQEEKEVIAKKYVFPHSLEKHGLKNNMVKVPIKTLRAILNNYAREPGVRSLQQQMNKICRRIARIKVEKKQSAPIVLQPHKLDKWLGPQRFFNEAAVRFQQPGIMVGLAWTPMGGEVLFIEAIALEGTGELKLTGKMGDVMMESAKIALSHVKKYLSTQENLRLKSLVVDPQTGKSKSVTTQEWFKTHDIHLHIPAGAVPKDGPSAGITMASALLSLATGKLARTKFAMTGELSLVGKVLPVGGIKDKTLAAKRSGITHIVLPSLNEKDLKEIPPNQRKGLRFSFVSQAQEVFKLVLLR